MTPVKALFKISLVILWDTLPKDAHQQGIAFTGLLGRVVQARTDALT
jgi:hypothetical protein